MRTVKVKLGSRGYEIRIGRDLLSHTGAWLREKATSDKVVIITNPVVDNLLGDALKSSLDKSGFKPMVLMVPEGEDQKSLDTAARLYAGMQSVHAERSTPVLALGGGVIGDLAGFVSATYMRGLPLVSIPTTLLAQVDSSIGGKTAVDHGPLKNNIGVFHQPLLVISDTFTLHSLPQMEVSNGMAEVIKYAIIRDRDFFGLLEKNLDRIKSFDNTMLEEIIGRSATIKAHIVEKDEKDSGLRNILNFGHTVGHAIESASDYRIKHGQAVSIGMVTAAVISNKLGIFPEKDLLRLKNLLMEAGLPVGVPRLDMSKIIKAMEHDKKVHSGKIKFILPRRIGKVFISDSVSFALAIEVLENNNA
ncbi:MAG: 3-dehydroquinate synthase [Dehalococcoidia bacterium]|nr:3-dehydroquinate synthase [Dehalococcoidia bacterium]